MKRLFLALIASSFMIGTVNADPMTYKVDEGHTFITFQISHIGFSFLPGSFNDFDGSLSFDPENPSNSTTEFTIRTASIDTEHAERDKHLRSGDFFAVDEFPTAHFVSTDYEITGKDTGKLHGKLTLKGVTRPVTLDVTMTNAAKDPWGNDRIAFIGKTDIVLKDFNIDYDLGPVTTAELKIALEATRT